MAYRAAEKLWHEGAANCWLRSFFQFSAKFGRAQVLFVFINANAPRTLAGAPGRFLGSFNPDDGKFCVAFLSRRQMTCSSY